MLLMKDEDQVRAVQQSVLKNIMNKDKNKDLISMLLSDSYVAYHSLNVSRYSTQIAIALNLSEEEVNLVSIGALLHDIGKMKIPRNIIYKPSALTDDEYEIIQKHTVYGYEILRNEYGFDEELAIIARDHHEKLNGNGYLDGKTNIDKYTQIVTVADIFSALTEQRPYHEPYKLRDATNIISAETGVNSQFLDILIQNTVH